MISFGTHAFGQPYFGGGPILEVTPSGGELRPAGNRWQGGDLNPNRWDSRRDRRRGAANRWVPGGGNSFKA